MGEHTKLQQEAEDGKKAVSELEELKKVYDQTKTEMEQIKALPRAKLFRPLKSGSMLDSYRERIDFTAIALKSTGSKFLEGLFAYFYIHYYCYLYLLTCNIRCKS